MKSKITLLVLLFSVLSANAQLTFNDHVVVDNSLNFGTSGFVTADFDGDGDKDILNSSSSDNRLIWLENLDGVGGDYTAHDISTTLQYPWGVYAADLDGDGDMDAVAAFSTSNQLAWYENTDGHGNFVLKQGMYAFQASMVKAADMDNDGDMDLIWASKGDGTINGFKNTNGLGNFSDSFSVENNVSSVSDIFPADMDGDGDLDILSASELNSNDSVKWYKNNGTASNFGNALYISTAVDGVTSVYAGDMDGDGDKDVVSSSGADGKIAWYQNSGSGTFGAQQFLTLNAYNALTVALADVDGDSDLDVVFGTFTGFKIGWFKNTDGLGNFSSEIIISSNLGGSSRLFFSDMDNDGDLDFLSTGGNFNLYRNTDGAGTFTSTIITKKIDWGRIVCAADFDGDGDKDIVGASYWDDKISLYTNKDGHGDFYNTQRIISNPDGANSVFAGDVNGDGYIDILATSYLSNDVIWYKNTDGLGNFGAPQIIDADLNLATRVFLVDIDHDGDMDVFALGRTRIVWYKNLDGQGTFSAQQSIDNYASYTMYDMDFGDLDGDGDLDISVASSYGLMRYLNTNGQGTFGTLQLLQNNTYKSVSTKIADIDNDGDNDLVYLGSIGDPASSYFLCWYKNLNGLGSFGPMQVISTLVPDPKSLVVADFDNDGDKDIAAAAAGNDVVTWYNNIDGLGNFANSQQIVSQLSINPQNLFAADMDGNGTMDIVSTSEDDRVTWHGNSGIPTNSINGTVRYDFSGDGCSNANPVLSGVLVVATDTAGTNATFSQENGHYQIYTSEEGIVTTKITSQLPNHYAASPVSFESNFTGLGNNDVVNFCIAPTTAINDLAISFYPTANNPRPGFNTGYRIVYRNTGTTQLSGTISFQFDGSKLNFLNASQAVASQTTNALTFDYANLNPFEIKTIYVLFNVFASPVTNSGEYLTSIATITPVGGDITQDDNVFSLKQRVVSSYDPNDITCLEGTQVLIEDTDKYLHYLIRFQNTGTASAINVRVNDILDPKLDWTTMQLESLSHTGRVTIHNGSEMNFIFDDIHLADSTHDEPNSHGFIAYKIKPKNNVVIGNIINATAKIYFDFNTAVVTNTMATKIVDVLSTQGFEMDKLTLYPNPTDGIVNINTTAEIKNIDIYNNLGQLVLSAKNVTMIDMSSLSRGIYVMTLSDVTGTTYSKKIVKK